MPSTGCEAAPRKVRAAPAVGPIDAVDAPGRLPAQAAPYPREPAGAAALAAGTPSPRRRRATPVRTPRRRRRDRGRHVRRRLLLVHGAALRQARRRASRRRRATWAARSATRPTRRSRAGVTGHAEVVQVVYDPAKVSYEKLLEVFWAQHRPDGEGPPVLRHGHAVPHRDLRPRRCAAEGGRSVEGRAGEVQAVQGADRHADRAGRRVLAGRGLPPGLLPQEPGTTTATTATAAGATRG